MSALPPPGAADLGRRGRSRLLIGLGLLALGILISAIASSLSEPGTYRVAIGPFILGIILVVNGLINMARSQGARAAGWHPDPTGRHDRRWWDGTEWTSQVSDQGVTGQDP